MSSLTYEKSGVDPHKADQIIESFSDFLKTRPRDPRLLSGIGPYASCFSLKETLSRFEDPLLVSCCDGVGTKSKLALDWQRIDRLGEDLVAMNVNDLLCIGAAPLLFLDYYACGKLDFSQLLTLLKSIQLGCELAECSLAGGETAEMPGLYIDRDFDLAGFSVGLVDKKNVLGESKVRPGQLLLGIESSGLHSNGYSLVRKLIEREKIVPQAQTPFSKETWAQEILKPTTIYVKHLKPMLNRLTGLAHITGGGINGNLPRIMPRGTEARIRWDKLFFTPLFQWIQSASQLSTTQMLETFNCGVGMIAACEQQEATPILTSLEQTGLRAQIIGSIEVSTSSHKDSEPQIVWE
ncbi:MAG: phosphoribosylformylglycinamidine cyclo-ligase [Deltaproteobacteria bacterium]|nr:phosphoribosylformylglycinamidine cyclo-ligase [Deltaproteobacteria bacterium]